MLSTLKTLVVEDNPGDARLVAEALRGIVDPAQTEYVERLEQALALLAGRSFDVMLLDLSLPDSHGLDTLTRVRAAAPNVPAIVLTATAEDETAIRALKLGAQDYVVKGAFDRSLLSRSIRYARERYQQQQALLCSWRELRAIIEMAPDGIGLIREGRILFANHALSFSLGYRPGELIGARLSDLLAPGQMDEGALLDSLRCPGDSSAKPHRRELQFRRKGDRDVAILEVCVGAAIQFEGATALPLTARDVTERKRMEAHLVHTDRVAALGALSAGIAHEINNPLTYVVANLGLMADELQEVSTDSRRSSQHLECAHQMLQKAREGSERVRQAVARLNSFARVESGQPRPVDLREVVAAVAGVVGNDIRHRARLVTEVNDTPAVMGDDARLGQVLLNLVVNAALNIPEGRADRHEIRVTTKLDGPGFVVIEVCDTGPGIPREYLDHIFEPFVQFPASAPGGRLSLSIARSIVVGLGGHVEAESRAGRGSVFRVALPVAERVPGEQPAAVAAKTRPARRCRLLIVDDEPDIAEVLATLLAREYDVVAVTNGREALGHLTGTESFDAVLCDLMMPVMTGMDLYEEIRRAAPHMAERFIFMTGGAFTPRAHQFLKSIDNLKLDKPFDLERLTRLLAKRLSITPDDA